MANYKLIIPFTKAWEGGLSRATTDKASANPAPWPLNGINGYHTNRGITFTTFSAWAPKFGYAITPENFFYMPDDLWLKIFKGVYWDGLLLDQVKSEAIAAALSQWEWGSGDYGAGQSLRKYLASKGITATTDQQQVDAINKLAFMNEEQLFRELIDWRADFFKSLNQPANLKGWLNRLMYGSGGKISMLQFGLNLIKKKRLMYGAIAVAVIAVIVVISWRLIKINK